MCTYNIYISCSGSRRSVNLPKRIFVRNSNGSDPVQMWNDMLKDTWNMSGLMSQCCPYRTQRWGPQLRQDDRRTFLSYVAEVRSIHADLLPRLGQQDFADLKTLLYKSQVRKVPLPAFVLGILAGSNFKTVRRFGINLWILFDRTRHQEFPWLSHQASSVSGVAVGEGATCHWSPARTKCSPQAESWWHLLLAISRGLLSFGHVSHAIAVCYRYYTVFGLSKKWDTWNKRARLCEAYQMYSNVATVPTHMSHWVTCKVSASPDMCLCDHAQKTVQTNNAANVPIRCIFELWSWYAARGDLLGVQRIDWITCHHSWFAWSKHVSRLARSRRHQIWAPLLIATKHWIQSSPTVWRLLQYAAFVFACHKIFQSIGYCIRLYTISLVIRVQIWSHGTVKREQILCLPLLRQWGRGCVKANTSQ